MVRQLLQQFIADRAIDHLLHVGVIAKHEGQIEHVELGNKRAHRPDAGARDGKRPDLGLLDHLLFAAELHRRVHLDADPPASRRLELLAHGHDRLDRGVAERMHIGRLEDELRLRRCRPDQIGWERAKSGKHAEAEQGTAIHEGFSSISCCVVVAQAGAADCARR